MMTLPRGFVGPVPGGTLLDEIASLGGDEFRWFMRHGNGSHISDFHGQLRTLLAALVEMRGALEPFAKYPTEPPEEQTDDGFPYGDDCWALGDFTFGHFRRARLALQQKEA